MKAKLLAIIAMLWASSSAQAACPTQETTVLFVNGVWTTEDQADHHSSELELAARERGLSSDCVHFDYSHTEDNGRISDIVEAMVQKSVEQNVPLLEIVRVFFLVNPLFTIGNPIMAGILDQIITVGYERELALNEAQAQKHLNKLKSLAIDPRHRAIILTHSQGGLYGNRVFDLLTPEQQVDTRMISTATPAAFTAGGGPNTRLSRDGVANRFFLAGSTAGLVSNDTRLCNTENELKESSWPCHQFEEGYLYDVPARRQIIDHIVAALPAPPFTVSGRISRQLPNGLIAPEGGVAVSLIGCFPGENFCRAFDTISDANGRYSFIATVRFCNPCRIAASKSFPGNSFYGGESALFPTVSGGTYHVDITLTSIRR